MYLERNVKFTSFKEFGFVERDSWTSAKEGHERRYDVDEMEEQKERTYHPRVGVMLNSSVVRLKREIVDVK